MVECLSHRWWSAADQRLAVGDVVVLENRDLLDHVISIAGPQPVTDVVLDRARPSCTVHAHDDAVAADDGSWGVLRGSYWPCPGGQLLPRGALGCCHCYRGCTCARFCEWSTSDQLTAVRVVFSMFLINKKNHTGMNLQVRGKDCIDKHCWPT